MQLTIERDKLLDGLAKVVPVVPSKTEVVILRHLLLSTGAKSLSMRATNCDVEMSVTVPAEVSEQGVGTISGRMLYELVRKFPKESEVSLVCDTDGGEARLACGRSRFTLPVLSADDFPTIDAGAGGALFELPSNELRTAFEKVDFAVCADETRYMLGGVHLHVDGEHLVAVATDGHRLSLKKLTLPPQAHGMPPVIVPRDTVRLALKILPENETLVELCVTPTRITVHAGETALISKLIDGEYPDYKRVIPQAHLGCAIVSREALMRAAGRVAIVLDERSHALRMRFGGESAVISGRGSLGGNTGREEVADVAFDAEAVTIGLNASYLGDALSAIGGAQVAVRTGKPSDPVLFEEVDGDGSHIVVQMPMRVDDQIGDKE